MTFAPLPSDGVPHQVFSDTNAKPDGPCACTDCRVERRVVIEQAIARHNRALDDDAGVPRKFTEAPAKRRANPRRRGR